MIINLQELDFLADARRTRPNKLRFSFSYDSQSRRIRKVVEEQSVISNQPSEIRNYEVVSDRRFLYDGWNLVAEFEMNLQHSSFALHTSYAWGLDLSGTEQGAGGVGGLLCISRATENGQRNTSLPTFDGNGNVLALYDLNSQTLTARYEYGPFGETLVAEGPAAAENAFRFSTKYTDEETGLLYYGYRYYSADLGRWLNRDPIGERGGLNLYGMCFNNPINWFDTDGRIAAGIAGGGGPGSKPFSEVAPDYDVKSEYKIPSCSIEIIVGHFTGTPHKFTPTGGCSGASLLGCNIGGGTHHDPNHSSPSITDIPPKDITPFPGANPPTTEPETSDPAGLDSLAARIKQDFEAAKKHAGKLCEESKCKCEKIHVEVKLMGLGGHPGDGQFIDGLKARGIPMPAHNEPCKKQ